MITAVPLILFVSATLALWLAALIRQRASAPGGYPFMWLMASVALWCLTSAFHGLTPSLDEKILWAKVQYLGIATVPPLWFAFLSDYVGARWSADRRVRIALGALATTTILLAFTNEAHHLIWRSVRIAPNGLAAYEHGEGFWVVAVYHYVLLLAGTYVLVRAMRRSPAAFKGQFSTLIAASVVPWACNAVYLFEPQLLAGFDATPLSFAFSGLLFTWALYRTFLFDLIPVAHDMLVDSLSDGVVVVDPAGRVLDMNAAARNLGQPGVSWIGKTAREVFPFLANSELTLSSTPSSTLVATSDPDPVHYDVRTMPVRARGGSYAAWVMLVRDVSAQMHAQAERDALESRVQEQQKRESLSVLAGGLAHDFNNLLAGIVGNADLLALQIPPSSGMGGHIGAIILGAQRAADLVAKMLAYAGERHGSMETIDLDALIIEMLELLRASAARHCSLQYHGEPAVIVGDATQIRQVAMNLIINAAEAVEEHTGTVVVSTGVERLSAWKLADMTFGGDAEPGTYAFLEVRDNGPGMDAETLSRIFNPFFTTKQTGHGLGLAAVQGIVRGHRGALHVDSTPGKGARFCVWFPVAQQTPGSSIPRNPSTLSSTSKS
ncbi:MAG TPA: histidine kinase N-terminal 7TM domain-containing protein [Vicinamibacterales bacterium]|jgi:signal transduction histidine kinase|nr:histidine kinase N-terminal 7TM domain-containing protein [Vicinamibacterales bacterium]